MKTSHFKDQIRLEEEEKEENLSQDETKREEENLLKELRNFLQSLN